MTLPRAKDEICTKILIAILFSRRTFRFNELHRYLDENFMKISKVTLSKHLKHLVKSELLYREELGKQHVTYRFYDEKWRQMDIFMEAQNNIQILLDEEEEKFDKYTVEEQVSTVFASMIRRDLVNLRNEILIAVDPEDKYEYSMKILLTNNIWNGFKDLLLRRCIKNDEEYRTAVLREMDYLITFISESMISQDKMEKNKPLFKTLLDDIRDNVNARA